MCRNEVRSRGWRDLLAQGLGHQSYGVGAQLVDDAPRLHHALRPQEHTRHPVHHRPHAKVVNLDIVTCHMSLTVNCPHIVT